MAVAVLLPMPTSSNFIFTTLRVERIVARLFEEVSLIYLFGAPRQAICRHRAGQRAARDVFDIGTPHFIYLLKILFTIIMPSFNASPDYRAPARRIAAASRLQIGSSGRPMPSFSDTGDSALLYFAARRAEFDTGKALRLRCYRRTMTIR